MIFESLLHQILWSESQEVSSEPKPLKTVETASLDIQGKTNHKNKCQQNYTVRSCIEGRQVRTLYTHTFKRDKTNLLAQGEGHKISSYFKCGRCRTRKAGGLTAQLQPTLLTYKSNTPFFFLLILLHSNHSSPTVLLFPPPSPSSPCPVPLPYG